jgi:hypothetical protein
VDNIKTAKRRIQIIKGVSYVYEDFPYWDKITKQNRHRRDYIGKLGQDDEFIPNNRFLSRQNKTVEKGDTVPLIKLTRRYYFGATHLLDEISRITGIQEDLRICFPQNDKMLMSMAYYLVLESESPMY